MRKEKLLELLKEAEKQQRRDKRKGNFLYSCCIYNFDIVADTGFRNISILHTEIYN